MASGFKESVPAVETVRACNGQMRQQGNALGVFEHSRDRESVALPDVETAQCIEAYHPMHVPDYS